MIKDQTEKEELLAQMQQYEEDYELLTVPFGIRT